MSFDIFLARFERGVLADAPREPVLQALSTRQYAGPDKSGFYTVELPDGSAVEFSARGLELQEPFQKCAFHVRSWGSDFAAFLFDVAKAGRFAVVPAMEGNPVLLVEEDMRANLPADMLEDLRPLLVGSAGAMAEALSVGFSAWAEYRDLVVGDGRSKREPGGPTNA